MRIVVHGILSLVLVQLKEDILRYFNGLKSPVVLLMHQNVLKLLPKEEI